MLTWSRDIGLWAIARSPRDRMTSLVSIAHELTGGGSGCPQGPTARAREPREITRTFVLSPLRADASLHRRERGRAQDRGRHLLHDRAVLLALGEHPGPLGVLGEAVELGHPLVQARPGQ